MQMSARIRTICTYMCTGTDGRETHTIGTWGRKYDREREKEGGGEEREKRQIFGISIPYGKITRD